MFTTDGILCVLCVLFPKIRMGTSLNDCAGPTLPLRATTHAERTATPCPNPSLCSALLCLSLPPPTQTRLSDNSGGGSVLPLPWHLGFPMSPPAEGVVSVVWSPQLIFHQGHQATTRKRQLLTQTLLRSATSSVSHY